MDKAKKNDEEKVTEVQKKIEYAKEQTTNILEEKQKLLEKEKANTQKELEAKNFLNIFIFSLFIKKNKKMNNLIKEILFILYL